LATSFLVVDKKILMANNFLMANKPNGLLTKNDLLEMEARIRKELQKKADKDDLKRFATKDDLNQLREELVVIKDEVVGELKAMREEFEVHAFSHSRLDDEIDDHEKRIKALETKITL